MSWWILILLTCLNGVNSCFCFELCIDNRMFLWLLYYVKSSTGMCWGHILPFQLASLKLRSLTEVSGGKNNIYTVTENIYGISMTSFEFTHTPAFRVKCIFVALWTKAISIISAPEQMIQDCNAVTVQLREITPDIDLPNLYRTTLPWTSAEGLCLVRFVVARAMECWGYSRVW